MYDGKDLTIDTIDRFHNDSPFIYSFISMLISLSALVSVCKSEKNFFNYFQTRPKRLISIHIKD